ncbi:MAG: hypothetical protein RL514_3908 [Verrucomicrobiota bacterium]|jgi:hypothetical protein
MPLPSREEINIHDSLDERWACEKFLGKGLNEAEAMFRENSLCYMESLCHMGPLAFHYYVRAAINYLKSAAAAEDCYAVSGFASIIECRLCQPSQLMPVLEELVTTCVYITERWAKFDSSEFDCQARARYTVINAILLTLRNNPPMDSCRRPPITARRFWPPGLSPL